MRLYTSSGLAYPITVTKLLCQEGGDIKENGLVFGYRYRAVRSVYDEDVREDVEKELDHWADFESEVEGQVTSLDVKVGQVINGRVLVADIEEPCKHEVQFGGMCANCSKDMSTVSYSTTVKNTQRATINTVHGHTALLVSQAEASRADEEAKRRLLDSRKLSLVVDLDQTVIQATVDPTIGEWQQDEANPNHDAVKDVRKFQLVDDGPGGRGTWYYIKLRPGLQEFLQTISQYFELHIYTMATRAYAKEISNIVDPDHKLFADRILSRDENGSMNSKNLKRLFPVDTKMVVIIDDRGDVWSWSPNLVKVSAYDFFVGIGDINSSFLPKRPELEARPKQPAKTETSEKEPVTNSDSSEASSSEVKTNSDSSAAPSKASTPASTPPATNGDVSAVDRMVSMAGKQDEGSMEEKTEEQDKTIAAQLADRPLLQKQKMLDAAEEEAKTSPAAEAAVELLAENGDKKETPPPEAPKYRHNLLQDDDTELEHLTQTLRSIHQCYFDEFEKENASPKGGRVAELRPGHSKKRSIDELERIPDAAIIMASMKNRVLAGINIVFSGVVPLGVDIHHHDLGIWAKSFGATVSENIGKRTTHVIASPERRTAKVRQAAKKGRRIGIVNQNWLYACFSQWKRVDEGPYRIHTDATANGKGAGLPDSFEDKKYSEYVLSSSDEEAAQTEDETDGTGSESTNGVPSGLEIDTDLEDLEQYAPTVERKDNSPVGKEQEEDWSTIRDEIDDFLGSEADESDTESVRSDSTLVVDGTKTPPSQRKRKRDVLVGDGGDGVEQDGEDEYGETRLQKRKKEALARTSSLTNIASASLSNGSSPAHTSIDPGGGSAESLPEDENEDEGDDLEAALAAEMEKQDEEDGTA